MIKVNLEVEKKIYNSIIQMNENCLAEIIKQQLQIESENSKQQIYGTFETLIVYKQGKLIKRKINLKNNVTKYIEIK